MATADTSLPPSAAAPAVKVPMMTLLLCCVVMVLFAVGSVVGAVLYLGRKGKLGGTSAAVPAAKTATADSKPLTHPKSLDPMLINLADDDGHAYLRIDMVLAEADEPGAKPKEEAKPVPGADASVRDTIFDVLGRENSAGLLAPDGKEKLKADLMKAITEHNPELHVQAIYFTDFLVQR
jgi:flagellar FliL protein